MPSVNPSGTSWRKSSCSAANGDCVEAVCLANGYIGVRDSKDTENPVLSFTPVESRDSVEDIEYGHRGRLAHEVLKSDAMTARLCRIIITTALSLVPLASIALIVIDKAPPGLKYMLECGPTLLIAVGAWIVQNKRFGKHANKRPRHRNH
jgi:Domain of unknown function (DUF397)